eukprot:TRINITY_DN970_c0_g1_i1.p1 TRINITY_DN970_c0_g1~~TRINITY_DN970_c0_g1_i1.p1  ORF type:complete len:134 (+),score=34.78 TRINITY_DN970_c0_g1_i1:103-504(+)
MNNKNKNNNRFDNQKDWISIICWGIIGAIHAVPSIGLFNPWIITKLYDIDIQSNAFLLLHHRAALFLSITINCIWAIFNPNVRKLAAVTVGLSMISFLFIYWNCGSPIVLRNIAQADCVGLFCLIIIIKQFFK